MKNSLFVMMIVFLTISCVKNNTDGPNKNSSDSNKSYTELNVPANFAWNTSSTVVCNFTSPTHNSKVHLFTASATEPFASFLVGSDVESVAVNLPTTMKTVTVKYETESGLSAPISLQVTGQKLSYAVPANSKPIAVAINRTASRANNDEIKDKDGVIYYPAEDFGTLMFEDLWPSYGDFDFNDFVIQYRIQMNLHNQNAVDQVYTTLRIVAIGGSLPFDAYLQLNTVMGNKIRDNLYISSKNAVTRPTIELLNKNNDPAVFKLGNLRANANHPSGGTYLNTSEGYEMAEKDMIEFSFYIDFNGVVQTSELLLNDFNFFIGKAENGSLREIHLGGQTPTEVGKTFYETIKNSNATTNASTSYYHSNTNLVWAINVAAKIPHAYEKVPFIEAYPEFITWAQSGGVESSDWYSPNKRNNDKGILVKY